MDALILSDHADTNGGNARHKRAADRYGGHDRIRSLILSEIDTAGVAGRYKAAADRLGTLRIRSVHRTAHSFRYPGDIRWNNNTATITRLYDAADVIHLNNRVYPYQKLDRGRRKPGVLHHHGTPFRMNPGAGLRDARLLKLRSAVSTLDLTEPAPDVLTWLPIAYDLNELAELRRQHRREPDGRVLIVSAPSNRKVKSTDALEVAVADLQAEGLPIDLDVIENVTHAECLARKARADIYFDQVILGYGCNAIEAWGMGIPVIAGAQPYTLDLMRREFDGRIPFYQATEATIADALRTLVKSTEARTEWALRGMAHVDRFHGELPALERLADLYMKAIAMRPRRTVAA